MIEISRKFSDIFFGFLLTGADDGYSGTNFQRPAWQKIIEEIENGKVASLIVKHIDRVGRDYLQVGFYTEVYLKEHNVRFIALANNMDTDKPNETANELAPFVNIMAEWFARDTGRKIKAVANAKGNAGKPLSYNCIYGYKKSTDDKNIWEVDDEAAAVVKRIFQMAFDGMGTYQIARKLSADKVEKPSAYFARTKGWAFDGKGSDLYAWNGGTVKSILKKPEYCGHTVNFRTYKESYKTKKFKYNDPSAWKIFKGTHTALVDESTFETVQKLIGTTRRPDRCGEANPLTGLLFCHECKKKMYNSRQSKTHYTEKRFGKEYQHKIANFYTCSTNSLAKGVFTEKCTQHYIRTEVVRTLVLDAIKQVACYVRGNEAEFAAKLQENSTVQQAETEKLRKKQFAKNEKRIAELDTLFRKVYEDNAVGKLSDERYTQMSDSYEAEQAELKQKNVAIQAELQTFEDDKDNLESFVNLVKKYTEFEELSTQMLNAFIDRIEVYEADKFSGTRRQQIDIYFNFIGNFIVPSELPAPPTAEEIAAEEKRQKKLEQQREANRRWYAKKKAIESGEIPEPTPEELAAAEQAEQAKQVERELKRSEYKRDWARNNRVKKSAVQSATS